MTKKVVQFYSFSHPLYILNLEDPQLEILPNITKAS